MKDFVREKYSKGHHYLPVFYLKGFSNDETLIHVYDKIEKCYLPKSKPESKFKENNLNNFVHNNQIQFTYEESLYTPLDTKSSRIFDKIKKLTIDRNDEITIEEQLDLLYFITHLFWRNPNSNATIEKIIREFGFSNKYFHIKNKKTGRIFKDEEIPDVINSLLNNKENQKALKTIYPLMGSSIKELFKLVDDLYLFYLKESDKGLITGDMPILISNDNFSLDQIFQKLIFPISKYRLAIVAPNAPKFFESNLLHTINVCIFHQSKRFVCSDNKDLLDIVIEDYSRTTKYGFVESINDRLFKMVDFQSKFSNFNEYYDKIMNNNR